ncbi:MAG: phosphoribosyltransferase domain-containing protein [Lachnospiraceae bacterium]
MRKNSYTTAELVRVAGRDGNKKRPYLLVDPLQGKHVPVQPDASLSLFYTLGEKLQACIEPEKKVLLIAFAETATAIGAGVAGALSNPVWEMQTTRENVEGASYLFFSESHSHATEQRLVENGLRKILKQVDMVVFAEDEVTTGNTIRKLIEQIQTIEPLPLSCFKIASLLNGMTDEIRAQFDSDGIDLVYLAASDNAAYAKQLQQYRLDGTYHTLENVQEYQMHVDQIEADGFVDLRMLQNRDIYEESVKQLEKTASDAFFSWVETLDGPVSDVLVLGTEECMYAPLRVAAKIAEKDGMHVHFHATTRSPICVSTEESYPLHARYELKSVYESERVTYLYDLRAYDAVCIVTDADCRENPGYQSLIAALQKQKNTAVFTICWK